EGVCLNSIQVGARRSNVCPTRCREPGACYPPGQNSTRGRPYGRLRLYWPAQSLGLERAICAGCCAPGGGSAGRGGRGRYPSGNYRLRQWKRDSGKAYAKAIEDLIASGAGLVFSTSFDNDPFLLAGAAKHPDVVFRQASVLANVANPKNVGSQNGLINQGHY